MTSLRVLLAHNTPCPYCARLMRVPRKARRRDPSATDYPTRDHMIPRSLMPGQATVMVCRRCNQDKANRTLEGWAAILERDGDPRAVHVRRFIMWLRESGNARHALVNGVGVGPCPTSFQAPP